VIGKTIAEISPGDVAWIRRTVAETDVARFVDAVGDANPVHSDPAYAATTVFKAPIAPGIFTAGLISAVIGTRLPGPGTIYLSQSLTFVRPVLFEDTITARVEVAEILRERNRLRLITTCTNQRDEAVLTGEAWVMPSRSAIVYEREAGLLAALVVQPWRWTAQVVGSWGTLSLAMFGIREGRT
jgi:3-hydroxybutyryl-CoA dehydratase